MSAINGGARLFADDLVALFHEISHLIPGANPAVSVPRHGSMACRGAVGLFNDQADLQDGDSRPVDAGRCRHNRCSPDTRPPRLPSSPSDVDTTYPMWEGEIIDCVTVRTKLQHRPAILESTSPASLAVRGVRADRPTPSAEPVIDYHRSASAAKPGLLFRLWVRLTMPAR